MGTNFYFIMTEPEEEKAIDDAIFEYYDAIRNDNDMTPGDKHKLLENLVYGISEHLSESKIHLGKRSGGWQFLWNHNNFKWYGITLESIIEFLRTTRGVIVNEYGDEFTLKQFIEEEIGDAMYHDTERYINSTDYHRQNPNAFRFSTPREITFDGVRYTSAYGDYNIGDIRFSTSTEFS